MAANMKLMKNIHALAYIISLMKMKKEKEKKEEEEYSTINKVILIRCASFLLRVCYAMSNVQVSR